MNNKQNQFTLPENVFNINNLFEKTKDNTWEDNPFKLYKKMNNFNLYIGKNINYLNYYYIDFPISKKINSHFVIKYFKNIDYRNIFSHNSINSSLINQVNKNIWLEEEIYKGHKTIYNVLMTTFQLFFYNDSNDFNTNTSQAKYYMAYKIFNNEPNYILRFELVLNNMDLDQDIDVNIYINMILNLLKNIHNKFKIDFETELILDNNPATNNNPPPPNNNLPSNNNLLPNNNIPPNNNPQPNNNSTPLPTNNNPSIKNQDNKLYLCMLSCCARNK